MASEFDYIARYFTRQPAYTRGDAGVALGVGDDAALLLPSPSRALAVTTDMLVAGTHFFPDTNPRDLGWKALAVNLSDLAAMGAQPRWALLALALPDAATWCAVSPRLEFDDWLQAFSNGLFECTDAFGVALVGGDTTRGPLTLSITAIGETLPGHALRRDGARPGDDLWVSGTPGLAAVGLAHLQQRTALDEPGRAHCLAALHRPQPRLALGQALAGVATACIDVSDGLLADLGHILERSRCAARLDANALPPLTTLPGLGAVSPRLCFESQWSGGDDYELAFAAPPAARDAVLACAFDAGVPVTRIGSVVDGPAGTLVLLDATGRDIVPARRGFDHFG